MHKNYLRRALRRGGFFRWGQICFSLCLGLLLGSAVPWLIQQRASTGGAIPKGIRTSHLVYVDDEVAWSILIVNGRMSSTSTAFAFQTREAAMAMAARSTELTRHRQPTTPSVREVKTLPHWLQLHGVTFRSSDLRRNQEPLASLDLDEQHSSYHRYSKFCINYAIGWPARSWTSRSVAGGSEEVQHTGLLSIGEANLPIIPVFRGIVVNAIVMSIPIWATFVGATLSRRVVRAKCGRCLDCGYSLNADTVVCPECGHEV